MGNISYQVEFFTDWHCGSGLAAGSDVDAIVIKDNDDLPFIPGRTIKGLIREAAEELYAYKAKNTDALNSVFEYLDSQDGKLPVCTFFSNAELSPDIKDEIILHEAQHFLYRSLSSISIDEDGISKKHSLRKIQVTVPCILYGKIVDVPDDSIEDICEAVKLIKRLGVNRNRGLGRCRFSVISEKEDIQ